MPEITEEAMKIATNGFPLEYLLKVHSTMHIGDGMSVKVLLAAIGSQSCLNSSGIQPKVSGQMAKGKTDMMLALLHMIKPKYKVEGSLSDKSIFYMNLNPGTIVFSDDVVMSEGLTGTIKRATSNFQQKTEHQTVSIKREMQKLIIPPRISWWFTSVDDSQESQMISRQFIIEVDETPGQDEKVLAHQKHLAETGEPQFRETDEINISREIIGDIKEHLFKVKIPYVSRIDWKDHKNRRNFPMFCDLIKSFAILRYHQRTIDEDGFLLANEDDYKEAAELYLSKEKTQTSKLNSNELKVVQAIKSHGEMDYGALMAITKMSKSTLSHIIHGRDGSSGLSEKVPGFNSEDISIQDGCGRTTRKKVFTFNGIVPTIDKVVKLNNNTVDSTNKKEDIVIEPDTFTYLPDLQGSKDNVKKMSLLSFVNTVNTINNNNNNGIPLSNIGFTSECKSDVLSVNTNTSGDFDGFDEEIAQKIHDQIIEEDDDRIQYSGYSNILRGLKCTSIPL